MFANVVPTASDSTHSHQSVGGSSRSGAARQLFGSSSFRSGTVRRQTTSRRTIKTTPKPSFHEYYDEYDDESGEAEHGEVHQVAPPFDPSFRVIGGVRVPGIESDVYGARRVGGERQDSDTWKAFDGHSGEAKPRRPNLVNPDDQLMHGNDPHMNDETSGDRQNLPCTLGCLNSEYLCERSCMCIPKYTRCDKEINCAPYGEDEEQCTQTNIEIINTMKQECEASEHHVMCPKTFVCIAKEFLCDGKFDILILR